MADGTRINAFLLNAKKTAQGGGKTRAVLGNEAADLDSMASAVMTGYFLSLENGDAPVVPVINIPRADFKLRTEAVYLFGEAGIDVSALTFVEEIDLETLASGGNLELVLVDHNKIAANQSGLLASVSEILDHHADDGDYPKSANVDIRPVGSAMTLVADRFIAGNEAIIDDSAATLMLGTILLDTVNLDPEAGRVKEKDIKAANALKGKATLGTDDLFAKLQFEKFNVSSLGSYDLLRKDYKEWQMGSVKCGIGSVLLPAADWHGKDPDLFDAFRNYADERGLDVLIAMNAFTNPEFSRDLGVFAKDADMREKLVAFLEGSDLGLEAMDISGLRGAGNGAFYHQKNLGISRKKLQPVLSEYFGA